jgi:uncharacterized protein
MAQAELLPIVALYVGLNALILIALGVHVGRVRQRTHVLIGDGGKPALIRAMRGQANFVEYVPMALLILLMMALMGAPAFVLHLFGLMLTAGRVMHGLHFAREGSPVLLRGAGAGLTFLVVLFGALGIVAHALVGGL